MNNKIKLSTFKAVMKKAIEDGEFIFDGKTYVILKSKEHYELNLKAIRYDRIKEYMGKD